MKYYVIYAYRDIYQLPLAILSTISEVCQYIGCSKSTLYRLLAYEISHIDGYAVDVVT